MSNNLLKKFTEFGIGNFLVLISGFISTPIITRVILPEEFGKFSMFNTVTNLFIFILLLGLDQAYMRFFYEEDEEARPMLLRKIIRIPFIVNFILSVILIVFYKPLSNFIIGEYSLLFVWAIIIHNTFNILGQFTNLVVRMQQKGKLYSLLQVTGRVFYIAIILLTFTIFKNDYRTLVIAGIGSNVIVVAIGMIIERKEWFANCKNKVLKTTKMEMLSFGIPLVFSLSITWVLQSIDKLFLTAYSGYTELGIYASAFTIVSLLNTVQNSFVTFWMPVANEKYTKNKENTEFFTNVSTYVALGMLLLAIFLITFKDLLVFILGYEYRDASYVFPFLVFMPIMFTISETTVVGINFKKKTKYHIVISIISAIINVIGNFILVPVLGAKGAAISTGASYIIYFAIRTVISKRLYAVNYNIKKLVVSSFAVIIFSLYASFNKINLTFVGLALIALIVTLIAYREYVVNIIRFTRTLVKRIILKEEII